MRPTLVLKVLAERGGAHLGAPTFLAALGQLGDPLSRHFGFVLASSCIANWLATSFPNGLVGRCSKRQTDGPYTRAAMPFDREQLRLERLNIDMAYDSAFSYWNLRGVLAERWAHGPVFGAWADAGQQVNLNPGPDADDGDAHITAMYGIKISGLLAEGERTEGASELALQWLSDVYEVLQPRRVTRISVQMFGLYPVTNPEQASRRLRSHYYRSDNLKAALPERLRGQEDRFHSAINWIVLDGDS